FCASCAFSRPTLIYSPRRTVAVLLCSIADSWAVTLGCAPGLSFFSRENAQKNVEGERAGLRRFCVQTPRSDRVHFRLAAVALRPNDSGIQSLPCPKQHVVIFFAAPESGWPVFLRYLSRGGPRQLRHRHDPLGLKSFLLITPSRCQEYTRIRWNTAWLPAKPSSCASARACRIRCRFAGSGWTAAIRGGARGG